MSRRRRGCQGGGGDVKEEAGMSRRGRGCQGGGGDVKEGAGMSRRGRGCQGGGGDVKEGAGMSRRGRGCQGGGGDVKIPGQENMDFLDSVSHFVQLVGRLVDSTETPGAKQFALGKLLLDQDEPGVSKVNMKSQY